MPGGTAGDVYCTAPGNPTNSGLWAWEPMDSLQALITAPAGTSNWNGPYWKKSTLPKDPWGNEKLGFEAETTINRKDYGLVWNAALETGGFLVGEEVRISVSIQAAA
mgnify:CR=1 FL=1